MKAYVTYWHAGGQYRINNYNLAGSTEVEIDGPEYTRLQNAQRQSDKLQRELAAMFFGRQQK